MTRWAVVGPCIVTVAVAALVGASAGVAGAHGQREIGDLEWTVGWAEEPAYVGFRNAVQLRLARGGTPVEGAEDDLEVEVILGDERTEALPLRAAFGSAGEYVADLIPTAPGDYTFHFTGTLDGENVDEAFTGSKDGFDEVRGTGEVSFPAAAPSAAELAQRIEGVERTAADARDAASLPRILSIAAIALAVIALGAASMRRRSAS